jgi:hypothetical protein
MVYQKQTKTVVRPFSQDNKNEEHKKLTEDALKYKNLSRDETERFLSIANSEYADYIDNGYDEEEALLCAVRIAQARV